VDEQGRRIVEPGTFTRAVGGGQPAQATGKYRGATEGLIGKLEVTGATFAVPQDR
jgi:hypothetical protein